MIFPFIILADDFNLPDITWSVGHGCINPSPAYGVDVNTYFLDIIYDLEQLVGDPTRKDRILDLVITTQPEMLKDVSIDPGMSDHEAITIYFASYSFSYPKQTNSPTHWDAYCKLRNLINKKLGKPILNTKAIYLITHLLETEGSSGNMFDPNIKKNVAYHPCPLEEFNTATQRKRLTFLIIILHQSLLMKIYLQFLMYIVVIFLLCLQFHLSILLE